MSNNSEETTILDNNTSPVTSMESDEDDDVDIVEKRRPAVVQMDKDSDDSDDSDDDDDDVVRKPAFSYQQQTAPIENHDDDEDIQEPSEEQDAFTSIWDMVGSYAQSPLETMLSKENVANVTLAQVLDEETLVQEIKAANQKVLDYLSKESNSLQLFSFLTTDYYKEDDPNVDVNNVDDEKNKIIFKYPFVASEVFSCDADEVNEWLVQKDTTIMSLFAYLTQKQLNKTSYNPALSQYYIKTMLLLVQKFYLPITSTLLAQPNAPALLRSIFVNSIAACDMDVLVIKLLGLEPIDEGVNLAEMGGEYGSNYSAQRMRELFMKKGNDPQIEAQKKKVQQWAVENQLLHSLLDFVEQNVQDEDASRNVFCIFNTLVDKKNKDSILHASVLESSFIQKCLTIALKYPEEHLFLDALAFARSVLDYAEDLPHEQVPAPVQAVHSATKDLLAVLSVSSAQPLTLSFGTLPQPLGEHRLKAVEHIHHLFHCSFAFVHKDLITEGALIRLLDLFAQYPYHSMLHVTVANILKHIIEIGAGQGVQEMKLHLLNDCKIVQRLLNAYKENEQLVQASQGSKRLGYMGQVIDLANLLRRCSAHQDVISQHLKQESSSSSSGWKEFVDGYLTEVNLVQERQLGGPAPNSHMAYGGYGLQNSMTMSNSNNSNVYGGQFEHDDDDDDDFIDSDDSSDDSDDEVVVKKE